MPIHRKHTPIVSKAQRGLFGAELARRRSGKKSKMSGISVKELESHLEESAGKKLPYHSNSPLHTNPMPDMGEPNNTKFLR
jgi:hypothetical protein